MAAVNFPIIREVDVLPGDLISYCDAEKCSSVDIWLIVSICGTTLTAINFGDHSFLIINTSEPEGLHVNLWSRPS